MGWVFFLKKKTRAGNVKSISTQVEENDTNEGGCTEVSDFENRNKLRKRFHREPSKTEIRFLIKLLFHFSLFEQQLEPCQGCSCIPPGNELMSSSRDISWRAPAPGCPKQEEALRGPKEVSPPMSSCGFLSLHSQENVL